MAGRTGDDRGDRIRRRTGREVARERRRDGVVERTELDHVTAARGGRHQLVAAHERHHQHRDVVQRGHQLVEERERQLVCPLHVFERDDDRPPLRRPSSQSGTRDAGRRREPTGGRA